ncbi:MAG: hypothetical protein QOG16_547 [Actinomycetota bacterium]|jgi:signal transduction histidine kinase|nr:hypothetical protein [Actinomycetota bacterium]
MKRSRYLVAYTTAITILGMAALAVFASSIRLNTLGSGEFLLLTGSVILGEFVRIRIPHGKESVMVTVGDPFTLALLFSFGIGPALIAKASATVLEDLYRKQVWWKLLFNIAQFALSLSLAYSALRYLLDLQGHTLIDDPRTLASALVAGLIYFIVNMALVTTAIAIATDQSPTQAIKTGLKARVINQGVLIGFAPIVIAALDQSLWLFPLMLIPIVVVYRSGMISHRHVQMAEQLTELYETTRITNARVETRDSVRELLVRVCNMFDASGASIVFFAREGEDVAHETFVDLETDSFRYMQPATLDPTQGIWARVASENKALMLANPIENATLRAHYDSLGIKDIMVAPMRSEEAVNGLIRVFNRRTQSQTFSAEDLRLFETLANHASIALENARLINQLEDSLAHLTEMNRLKDDFVASVSHELRTPLTSIQGFVKTLLRPDASFTEAEQRSFLETVDRQSGRLHRLIEDLLAVSRIESRTDTTSYHIVSLQQIAHAVVEEVHNRALPDQIEFDFDGELPVETDGGKVHQILANLVDNALKYGGAGNPILVKGVRDGEGASIAVSDRGSGVPAELQERVFDRFYQVDQSATRSVGGAGLGLYICRRMAEAIGGRVWLEKTGPEGSTFTLWVPASPGSVLKDLPVPTTESVWKI